MPFEAVEGLLYGHGDHRDTIPACLPKLWYSGRYNIQPRSPVLINSLEVLFLRPGCVSELVFWLSTEEWVNQAEDPGY